MVRDSFTLYTKKLDGGYTVNLTKTLIDTNGSFEQIFTGIYEIYDTPPPEQQIDNLSGQLLWNDQYIVKNPGNTAYALGNWTLFLKNGSINLQYNTFNWSPITLTPFIGTIIYGTGEYLGAEGYVVINAKEVIPDPCGKFNNFWTVEATVIFTN